MEQTRDPAAAAPFRQLPGREYLNSLCEICNEDNELLAFARLRGIDAEGIYEFEVTSGARLKDTRFDAPVKVNVMNLRLGLRVLSGNLRIASKESFRVLVTGVLADVEQRGFVRVHVQEPAFIHRAPTRQSIDRLLMELGRPGPGNEAPTRAKPLRSKDTLVDISISGCRFSSGDVYKEGDRFVLRAFLWNTWVVQAAKIVRVQHRDKRYFYGCQFLEGSDPRQADVLAKVIFGLQNEKRKKLN